MIKMIAAVSINGIIGADNTIPWQGRYPDDMAFFRKMTKNSVVVMGRKTYETLGSKPLPYRENRIVGRNCFLKSIEQAISFPSIEDPKWDIWLIGGQQIYEQGMQYANEIYLTCIPESVDTANKNIARFPFIHPMEWTCEKHKMYDLMPSTKNQNLVVATYRSSKMKWY